MVLGSGLVALGALLYIVLSVPPDKGLKISGLSIPSIPLFFILFFVAVYGVSSFVLNNKRNGLLIGFFATLYFILRLNGLKNIFFAILILALFVTFELLFKKRK